MKYFVMEVRVGVGLDTTASSLRSSSVMKGLMFCGFMARDRVRENLDHTSAGCEGGSTGGSRCTEGSSYRKLIVDVYNNYTERKGALISGVK